MARRSAIGKRATLCKARYLRKADLGANRSENLQSALSA